MNKHSVYETKCLYINLANRAKMFPVTFVIKARKL